MSKSSIIISAAGVAAAVQAVAGLQSDGHSINVSKTDAYANEVRAAVSGAQAQAAIRATMPQIARGIRVDDKLLSDRYAEVSDEGRARARDFITRLEGARDNAFDTAQQSQPYEMDSTVNSAVLSCYANCHSACHGSRSWR